MMSAGAQYIRKLSLIVATSGGQGTDFADFRCQFTVRRGDFQTPNSLDARIFNLSANTANTICGKEFTQVSLSGGYEGAQYGQIFQGTIKQARQGRIDAKDSYVDITAADGDRAYNYAGISKSLVAQASNPGGIASALLAAMQTHGVTAGYMPTLPTNNSPRGVVLYGAAKDELREFAESNDMVWSIQDGQLVFIPKTSYVPSTVPVISPASGLIGVPEQVQNGIRMRVLLNNTLKVGQVVQLVSGVNAYRYPLDFNSQTPNSTTQLINQLNSNGLYYVMVANHVGDTRGADWYTDLICLSVDASVPEEDAKNALNPESPDAIPRI